VAKQKLEEKSKLVPLLNSDPKFFYYGGNNNGSGLGKFQQKSLQYGDDRRGSGDSGQPYIITRIPNRYFTSSVDDGFIRGGWALANRASSEDSLRINKFLKDSPKGPLFIKRQIGLQLSNPKLETRKLNLTGFGLLGGLLTAGFNVFNELTPGPTRLYNQGKNTLAQLSVNAFGTHFERHGLSPVQDDNTKYLAVVRNNNENGNNRLLALKRKLIRPNIANPNGGNIILGTINAILGAVNVLNTALGRGTNPLLPTSPLLQPQDLIIDRYAGGPGSVYGVGFTTIRRYDVTSNGFNKPTPSKGQIDYAGTIGVSNKYYEGQLVLGPIYSQNPTNKPSQVDQTAVRYKQNIPAGANGTTSSPTSRKYADLRSAIKTNITQKTPGSGSISTNTTFTIDRSAKDFAYFGSLRGSRLPKTDAFNRYDPNILSIVFRIIDPFTQAEDAIILSAYMKGFRDNFDASWNEYSYAGRSESFYTYGKFKRNVNFSLDIPCFNKAELLSKYRALGQLASTTAGSYNENGLLGGVLIKLNVGNHVRGEYAILNNLSYEIPDESSWDVDSQLAMLVKATFSFTIIHSNLPQYKKDEGFYNHVDARVAISPDRNNQINIPQSTNDLIQYFSKEQKAPAALLPPPTI
jgi:hypothetical protein